MRYRSRLGERTPELLEQAGALVIGLAETVDASLERLGPAATLADALGARRRAETIRFSRASLRALLSPEITPGTLLAGGFTLFDVYPASHNQEREGARLELALEFQRLADEQRLIATIGPRTPGGRAFAETEHFSLGYLTLGRSEPEGAEALLRQLALVLALRDHGELEVIFPDTLADVKLPLLGPAASPAAAPRIDATLNLAISADCGQACRFCSVRELAAPTEDDDAQFTRYLADLSESRAKGITRLRLNGYDPLAYPRVAEVLRFAVEIGFDDLHVFSPATLLADAEFCEQLVGIAPAKRQFYVPLYGVDADIHDAVVGTPGAHSKVLRALENLVQLSGPEAVTLITAVTRTAVGELPRLREYARQRGFAFAAHMPYPSSESRSDHFFTECPQQSEVARTLADAGNPLIVRGVAPCVAFREYLSRGIGLRSWLSLDPRMSGVPGAEYRSKAFRHGAGDRDRGAFAASTVECPHASNCALREPCGGELLRAYLERFGSDEFRAVGLTDLLLSVNATPGDPLSCDAGLELRARVDSAVSLAANGAGAVRLLDLGLAADRTLRLRLETWDNQQLIVLWSEAEVTPVEPPSVEERGGFYAAWSSGDVTALTRAAQATLRRLLCALANLTPEVELPRLRLPRPREDEEHAEVARLLEPLVNAFSAGLAGGLLSGWSLVESRVYRYDRWEVDLRLRSTEGDRLGFLVHPKGDEADVFAETDRHALSYYSDDFSAAEHSAVFARNQSEIEATLEWLRGWELAPPT
ncbi:MAG: hypothetical protein H6718_26720 [Polyangiaceae bacterium]|nr:hypothetical protein [Polyangiaceae bacterium]